MRLDAQANVTYYIMVGWYTSEGGNLVLSAQVAPPPFTFDLQLDRKGSVEPSTGAATVKGTAICSQPSFVTAQGSLQQEKAGTVVDAFFYTSFFCDGTTPWSVQVSYTPRLFRGRSSALFTGGRADATAFANAYSPSEGEYRYVSVMGGITLTGSKE